MIKTIWRYYASGKIRIFNAETEGPAINYLRIRQNIFITDTLFNALRSAEASSQGRCWRKKEITPAQNKLHLGCGRRLVHGWLNVDIRGSEFDLDLSRGKLPWKSDVFDVAVSQHFIEHLEVNSELIPLLSELHRVIKSQGEIWLTCPDIEKICRSYINHKMKDLVEDKRSRWPKYSTGKLPSSHLINDLFHQNGAHKNLFDFDTLNCLLQMTGFTDVRQVVEADFLRRFPDFPPRNDAAVTIYVMAVAL